MERIETIGQAVRGVFRDPKWLKKSATGVLINLIPYLGAVWVMGYGLHYQRALAWGQGDRLPDWRPAEGQWRTGLYAFVVGMVYSMPLSMVVGAGMSAVIMLPAMTGYAEAMARPAYWVFYSVSMAAAMFIMLAAASFIWPAYVQVSLYDRIEAGFQFKSIFSIARQHSGAFWVAFRRSLGLMLLSVACSFLSMGVAFGVGILLIRGLASADWAWLLALVLLVVMVIVSIAMMILVTMPLGWAGYRLWAGYARIAYNLDATAVDPALLPA